MQSNSVKHETGLSWTWFTKLCNKKDLSKTAGVKKRYTKKKKKNLATKKRKFDTLSKLNKLTPDLHKLSRITGHEPVRNNWFWFF